MAEAEDGTVTGNLIVVADGARTAVVAPELTGNASTFERAPLRGYVEYCLTVPETGGYELQAEVRGPSTSSNSFWVTVDNHVSDAYRFMYDVGDYQNVVVTTYELAAGQHTIRFWVREDGSFLDSLQLVAVDPPPTTTTTSSTTTSSSSTSSTTAPSPTTSSTSTSATSTTSTTAPSSTTTSTSTTTTAPSTTTTTMPDPPEPCGPLVAEAEDGIVTGNFVVATLSGQDAVVTPERSGDASTLVRATFRGYVEMCVTVPSDGDYRLSGSVMAPSGSSNSFWVTVDSHSGPAFLSSFPIGSTYVSDYVETFSLTAGDHTIRYWVREDGAILDRIELVAA